jgi:hypothetical protein
MDLVRWLFQVTGIVQMTLPHPKYTVVVLTGIGLFMAIHRAPGGLAGRDDSLCCMPVRRHLYAPDFRHSLFFYLNKSVTYVVLTLRFSLTKTLAIHAILTRI